MVKQQNIKYKFEEELIEGIIKERKNRFIFIVEIEGKEYNCHCPSTGTIGRIIFKNIPCLLSKSKNSKRATSYTVEAISLDKPNKKNKKWIGINLVASNRYVEYFIKKNMFNKMIKNTKDIKRKKKLGDSKIDFIINDNCYLEVKSFLEILRINIPKYIQLKKVNKINAGDRFIKHMLELSKNLTRKKKAIILLVFQYKSDKIDFKVDKKQIVGYYKLKDAVDKFNNSGCELWQSNFSIDKQGISLIDYYKVNFYDIIK